MDIRDATADDGPSVHRVVGTAFGDVGVAELWADVVSRGLALVSLVAVDDDGDVVGHVGVSRGWLDARRALVDIAVLSPLSVDPDHQCRGVGTALVAAAVARSEATGLPFLTLEGSPRYYGARGFAPGSTFGVEPASRRTPGPACQVVALSSHEPWMTGRIVYRDVWWEHDSAGLRDPDLGEVETRLGVEHSFD